MDELTARRRYRGQPIRNRLAFVHVPKTGGTFLHELLAEHFSPAHTVVARNNLADISSMLHHFDLISGHYRLTEIASVADDYDLVTILRNPIDRFNSTIGHYKNISEATESLESWTAEQRRTYEVAVDGSPEEFIDLMGETPAGFNHAVMMLSSLPAESDMSAHAESAKENLMKRFLFATLANIERLTWLLSERFNDVNMLFRGRRNIGAPQPRLSKALETRLLKICGHDMELFEFASKREAARALDEYIRLRNSRTKPPKERRARVSLIETGEERANTISIAVHHELIGFHAAEKFKGGAFRYSGPDEIAAVFLGAEFAPFPWFEIKVINSACPERSHEISVLVNEEVVPLWFMHREGALWCKGRMPRSIAAKPESIVIILQTPFARQLTDEGGSVLDERKLGIAVELMQFRMTEPDYG